MAEVPRWRVEFADAVADATGLDFLVVYGWALAENGPRDNPLGISEGGRVERFGDHRKAAAETIALLRGSLYTGIMRAARTGDAKAQLRAIDASKWNSVNPRYGELIRGGYERAKDEIEAEFRRSGLDADSPLAPIIRGTWSVPSAIPGRVEESATAAVDAAGETLSGVAKFAFDKSSLALGYLVLTGAAVALFVMGLNRVSGASGGPTVQGGARMALAAATRGRGSDIPF